MKNLMIYLIIINIIAYVMMYSDKQKAIRGEYRISEKTLFLVCVLGGSLGGLIGMYTFRHKTKHVKFILGIPILLILNLLISIFIISKF